MLYGGLQRAIVNSRAIKLPELTKLNSEFKESSKEDIIILPILWFEYNYFDDEAVSISSQGIKKVANNNTALFKSRELFAVAPSVKKVKGRDFTFSLSVDFIFTNKETRPERILVDFDDGKGNTEINTGDAVHVNYSSAGMKKITTYYNTTEGNRLISVSTLIVDTEENAIIPGDFLRSEVPDITGDITGRTFQGAAATIEYYIYLGSGDTILNKPFFVLEGFDPYNAFSYEDLYYEIDYAGLRDDLFDEGYDLIFVNYVNSTDYIQRNAYALEELIGFVNEEKELNCMEKYENVIMGFSMGGLVARYALVDMENLDQDHDTRLYISYDSPHRGANVPIGYQQLVKEMFDFQYLVWTIRDEIPEIEDAYAIMDSPAARQMLILHALSGSTFINELAQMGMPQQCRNIALSNGSMQGVNYPDFEPGQKLLDLHYELDIIGDLWHFILDANCYALADNPASPERVCEWYYKVISWQSSVLSVASLPFDNAPGGIYDLESFGIDLNDIQLPEGSSMVLTSTGFCFVPTVSAFDIPIDATSLQASITSQSPTSFNAIFINNDSDNELHIDLTLPKVNWILQQIAIGDVIDCDGSCLSITGPSVVCNTNSSFTLHSLPSGSSCTWLFSGGNLVTPSSGNDTIATFRGTSCSNIGKGNLIFTVTKGTCSAQIVKSDIIINGPPYQDVTLSVLDSYGQTIPDQSLLCPYTTYHMYIHNNSSCSTSNYIWDIPAGWTLHYTYNDMASINTNDSPWGNVVVKAQTCCTGCGSNVMIHSAYFGESWDCGQGLFTIYPNPAADYIEIHVRIEKADVIGLNLEGKFDLTVTDIYGIVKFASSFNELPYRVNTANYSDGMYILKISYGEKTWTSRFMVKH